MRIRSNLDNLFNVLNQSISQLENKSKSIEKLQKNIQAFEQKSAADAEAVTQAQNHFHAVSAGLSSNEDGEEKTLADQLMGKTGIIFYLSTYKLFKLLLLLML